MIITLLLLILGILPKVLLLYNNNIITCTAGTSHVPTASTHPRHTAAVDYSFLFVAMFRRRDAHSYIDDNTILFIGR